MSNITLVKLQREMTANCWTVSFCNLVGFIKQWKWTDLILNLKFSRASGTLMHSLNYNLRK